MLYTIIGVRRKKGILYTFFVTVPLTIATLIANSKIKGARYLYLTLDVKI